jgi:hypothetical protein
LGIRRAIRNARVLTVAALFVSTVTWAQDAPIGVVQQADRARIKQGAVSAGSTVYGGEELSTDVGGVLAFSANGTGFRLLEGTRAFFYHAANGTLAELRAGTLAFHRDAGGSALTVVASDVRIVAKGDAALTGQVEIVSPCEIRVTSTVGSLDVTSGSETHTIGERESYSVTPAMSVIDVTSIVSPDDPGYHQSHSHKACEVQHSTRKFGGTPVGAGSSHFLKVALVAGGVVTAILLWPKHNSESPSAP